MFNRSNLLVVLLALCAGLGLWAGKLYFAGSRAPAANAPAAPAVDPAQLRTVRLHAPQAVPEFALQQSDGTTLAAGELRGRWTLVFLGFTHCPDVCPTTLATLAAAQQRWQALPEAQRPRVLFVSVDPARDSAGKTGEYAAFFHADTLAATAPEPALSAFAAGLGLVYMKVAGVDGDYSMDHSAALVLIDPQGRRAGLIQPPLVAADIADDLALLSKAAPVSPKVALQYLLPHRLLSKLAYSVARTRTAWFKDWLIALVIRKFGVNMAEALDPDPRSYLHFNAFFTRELKPGARSADADPQVLVMPADGKVSQVGRIEAGRIFQAKGQSFTAAELLGDEAFAAAYADGWFANIYLSPKDYHRVHMPWTGTLVETLHVPGRLFTVAPWGVQAIPRLFARNERLVCHFDTDFGPMCSVMVGALLVSGVESVWNGEEIPPYAHKCIRRDWRGQGITLERFAEMARFNYGSTVILLFPRDAVALDPIATETVTRLGERLGTVTRRS